MAGHGGPINGGLRDELVEGNISLVSNNLANVLIENSTIGRSIARQTRRHQHWVLTQIRGCKDCTRLRSKHLKVSTRESCSPAELLRGCTSPTYSANVCLDGKMILVATPETEYIKAEVAPVIHLAIFRERKDGCN